MAEIVNLNKFRKARQRAEKERRAAQNRSRYGQSKEARNAERAERDTEVHRLDGKKLDGSED